MVGPTRIYDSYLDHSLSRSLRLHCTFHIIWWVGDPTNSFHKEYVGSKRQRIARHLSMQFGKQENDGINLIATMITGVMMMVSWWRMEEEMVRAKTSSKGLQRSDW